MSCEICGRSSCTRSFHSLDEQERYDLRQEMSDNVDILREELQDVQGELKQREQENEKLKQEAQCHREVTIANLKKSERIKEQVMHLTKKVSDLTHERDCKSGSDDCICYKVYGFPCYRHIALENERLHKKVSELKQENELRKEQG